MDKISVTPYVAVSLGRGPSIRGPVDGLVITEEYPTGHGASIFVPSDEYDKFLTAVDLLTTADGEEETEGELEVNEGGGEVTLRLSLTEVRALHALLTDSRAADVRSANPYVYNILDRI